MVANRDLTTWEPPYTSGVSRYLVESLEFYITPCLNPDGYEYSHTSVRIG